MSCVTEKGREIGIVGAYDVVVVGGGIAGVAAAVAAARNKAKTCLLEKEYAPGGLATLGNVVVYLPLCDGMGSQVSFGLTEELLKLSTNDGNCSVPACWRPDGDPEARKKKRYVVTFNPASYILELENYLLAHGIDIYYDNRVCAVAKKADRIEAIIVENKEGRRAFNSRAIIDASGDADVCLAAGEKTCSLDKNSASGWYYASTPEGVQLRKLYKPYDATGLTAPPDGSRGFSGDKATDITAQMVASRQMIRDDIAKLRESLSSRNVFPLLIPTIPCFRMTRRLAGEVEFDATDRKQYEDSVGVVSDWRRNGPVYSIPFRALRAAKTLNLITAGRCISAVSHGWDVARAIPVCAVTGEAAGTAAALSDNFHQLEFGRLQKQLGVQGVKTQVP